MSLRPLSMHEAEFVAHRLCVEFMNREDEPIPAFHTRSPGKLESCLAEPFQTFGGTLLHKGFARKAAVLFYLVIKNHCFSNGNKRMAVALTGVFFYINKRWLDVDAKALYNVARSVAESSPKIRDEVVDILTDFFSDNTVRRPVSHAHSDT